MEINNANPVVPPLNNERLISIFEKLAKENTPENKNLMIDEVVMRAKFFTPVIIEPSDGSQPSESGTISANDKVKFFAITNNEQQKFLMGFTGFQELAKWKKGGSQQTLIFGFDDFATLLSQSGEVHAGLTIDPFGANLILPTQLVATLAEEKKRRIEMLKNAAPRSESIPAGTEIRLAQPKNYPIAMIKDITKYMKQHDEIKSGYLQLMLRGGSESMLIVVDSDKEDNSIFDGIIAAAKEQKPPMTLEFVWKSSDLGQKAASNIAPFYIK